MSVPIEPLSYYPPIADQRQLGNYRSGAFEARLVTGMRSLGKIQYTHVLWVSHERSADPILAVAAEVNAQVAVVGGGSHFLGLFEGGAHFNLGSSDG